jgi:phospholipid/cholesterol/gamma-HCH transport system substrate-binding protein
MSTELKVGAVVVVAIAAATGFILNMNDTANFFGPPTDVYRTRVVFPTASGLARDAAVRLAGVYVGRVEAIVLNDDGQAVVTMRIDNGVTLRADSTASVSNEGMLGEKFLELTSGTPGGLVVTDGGEILPGAPVSIDQMVLVMNNIAADAQEMATAMRNVLGGEAGETRMAAILDNTEALIRELGEIAQSSQEAIAGSVANTEDLTAALAESIPAMVENYQLFVSEATSLVSKNETGVTATIEEVRGLIADIDRSRKFHRRSTLVTGQRRSLLTRRKPSTKLTKRSKRSTIRSLHLTRFTIVRARHSSQLACGQSGTRMMRQLRTTLPYGSG